MMSVVPSPLSATPLPALSVARSPSISLPSCCQTAPVHSISAGLDYPGVGPEHAYWHDSGRVKYTSITDQQALEAFKILTEREGIIPALESSHALAHAQKVAKQLPPEAVLIVNLSGRGDKDVTQAAEMIDGLS